MIRLVHFSDIHLSSALHDWQMRDWLSKRTTSWINHRVLGRAWMFKHADNVIQRLMDDLVRRQVDHLIFSGDATALGFDSEVRRASEILRLGQLPMGGLAVPGNHDYTTRFAEASGSFETHFAPWQKGRRVGDECYPFAQQVGPIWLIGVNAATGNRMPWDASGNVGADQLERLRKLLNALPAGPKILVLHYPARLASGRREFASHGLRDLDALVDVAHAGGVSLWLHGHRHSPYHLPHAPGVQFPSICAGTATQRGIWSHGEYQIDGKNLRAVRRIYDIEGHCFRDVEEFSLKLA